VTSSGRSLDDVAAAVAAITDAEGYGPGEFGVLRDAVRPVRRLGLALDERGVTAQWIEREQLDALFVHRPWRLPLDVLPNVGLLFAHRPFDERLTTGANRPLAAALGLRDVRTFGARDGRPLAMVGDVDALSAASDAARVAAVFGGADDELPGDGRPVRRAAVAGAMTDALVREAAALGADLYVTGQLRAPGAKAAAETGVRVLAIGHRRSERWGLAALARALGLELPGLVCRVCDELPDGAATAR
jgi:putative NIF3 family GTP cyclohydrolase 1 type 2